MELEYLKATADALEQAGKSLEGRMVNPDYTATAVNEAGKYLVIAARQLRDATRQLAQVLDEKSRTS
jgi:uncharacterized protein Yka (UPF0111/DUF47 family)